MFELRDRALRGLRQPPEIGFALTRGPMVPAGRGSGQEIPSRGRFARGITHDTAAPSEPLER
jgi:hypothetical protein